MIKLFNSNKLLNFTLILYLILIYFFSDISQWREDQATNYWLGYYFSTNEIPIGLVSSRIVPNPNGMVLVGKLLGQIPSFRLSVFVYALIQSLLVLFFVKFLYIKDIVLEALLFSSLVLNVFFLYSVSELWSQYLSVSLNFLVIGILFYFVETGKPINLLTIFNLLLLLPTIYLSGFLNSFCLFLVIIFLLYMGEISLYFKLNFINLSILMYLVIVVWIPYFNFIDISNLFLESIPSNDNWTFWKVVKTIFLNNLDEPYIIQSDYEIFPRFLLRLRTLLSFGNIAINVLFIVILSFLIFNIFTNKFNIKISSKSKVLFIYFYSYLLVSPLIGGPNFFFDERKDMELQFYFIFTTAVFLLAYEVLNQIKFKKIKNLFITTFKFSMVCFVFLNSIYAGLIYKNYIDYEGTLHSNSDVPLTYKLDVLDFIVNDAYKNNNIENNSLNIYYDLSGKTTSWLDEFGTYYPEFYKSPYTIGRVFDVILLKDYNIINSQEGIQFRKSVESDYIVTYKYHTKIKLEEISIKEYKDINRFRIYLVDN